MLQINGLLYWKLSNIVPCTKDWTMFNLGEYTSTKWHSIKFKRWHNIILIKILQKIQNFSSKKNLESSSFYQHVEFWLRCACRKASPFTSNSMKVRFFTQLWFCNSPFNHAVTIWPGSSSLRKKCGIYSSVVTEIDVHQTQNECLHYNFVENTPRARTALNLQCVTQPTVQRMYLSPISLFLLHSLFPNS